jgi:hypothetical protein
MTDCERIQKCTFFKAYMDDTSKKLALEGFALMYCKGEKQNVCIRKKVCDILGAEKVPVNMMPNGVPISGSDDSLWSAEVKQAMRA